jgi:hypothetical protein
MPVLPRANRVGLGQPPIMGSVRYNVGAAITAVTGVNSTDTFTKVGHGLVNGDNVVLSALVGGTGLAILAMGGLFVVGVAGNNFQLARVPGGAAVDLGSDVTSVTVQKVRSGPPLPARKGLGRKLTRVR